MTQSKSLRYANLGQHGVAPWSLMVDDFVRASRALSGGVKFEFTRVFFDRITFIYFDVVGKQSCSIKLQSRLI